MLRRERAPCCLLSFAAASWSIVGSASALLVAGVLRLYDAQAEAAGRLLEHLAGRGVPELMRGSQEQGPLAYFLLKHARPGQVQPSPHALASIFAHG